MKNLFANNFNLSLKTEMSEIVFFNVFKNDWLPTSIIGVGIISTNIVDL